MFNTAKTQEVVTQLTKQIEELQTKAQRFEEQASTLLSALEQSRKEFVERTRVLEEQASLLQQQLAVIGGAVSGGRMARGTTSPVQMSDVKKPKETTDISAKVLETISTKPLTLSEIYNAVYGEVKDEATPERILKQRICNAIVKLQRERKGVINLGSQHRALWFRPGEDLTRRLRGN